MGLSPADRAALDANYNLRAAVPEHPAWFERYAATSAAFRARWPGRLDLALRRQPAAGDRSVPAPRHASVATAATATAGVHSRRLLAGLRSQGFLVRGRAAWSRRARPWPWSATTSRPRSTWTRSWHRSATPSPGCIAMPTRTASIPAGSAFAGHSAGGHLAAMALATDWKAAFGLPADLVKGVCAISGVFDLEPIRLCYLNEVLRLDAGAGTPQQSRAAAAADPLPGHGDRGRAGDRGVSSAKQRLCRRAAPGEPRV